MVSGCRLPFHLHRMAPHLWSFDNPAFAFYSLCSAILLFKTLCMPIYTGIKRFKHKNFSWPEDAVVAGLKPELKPLHPDLERGLGCHRNDLENIPIFLLVGLLYTLTNPSLVIARLLFGGFTVFRLAHTVIFVNQIGQPYRFLSFLVAFIINFVMLIAIIIHVFPLAI